MINRSLFVVALLLLLAPLTGCERNAYQNAEFAGTAEAWESFLEKYPSNMSATDIRERIDGLRFSQAKKDGNIAGFKDYLTRHPSGKHEGEALAAIDLLDYEAAARESSLASFEGYLKAHPDGAYVERSNEAHAKLSYLPKVTLGRATTTRTNMADDPEGKLNGWSLDAEITNTGDRTLRVVELHVDIKDIDGKLLKSDKWWAVAPDLTIQAAPPSMRASLEPGGVRTFNWTYSDMDLEREVPTAKQFVARVTALQFKD
jgi:outer membrane protein assembly factor BamD (BamD/ComL family)